MVSMIESKPYTEITENDKMLLDNVKAEFPDRAISNDDFKKIFDVV